MKATKKQKNTWIKQIESCLETYYNIPSCKRNQWRFDAALSNAKNQIEKGESLKIKGAQWGGKWGNWYRMIALNSKNEYQYVQGFNPEKYLL